MKAVGISGDAGRGLPRASAVVISVGTELVRGEILDTNAAYLSRELAEIGIETVGHVTVGDDSEALAEAVLRAASACEVVIVTGGIGPTPDDITRDAVARAAGVELQRDGAALAHIEGMFASRDRRMSPSNAVQADFPRGASIIANPRGTAAGFRVKVARAEAIVLPGVPVEMKMMWDATVRDYLAAMGAGAAITRTVNCFGSGESDISEAIGDLMQPGQNPLVGDTAEEGIIKIRIRATARTRTQALELIDRTKSQVKARLGDTVFGEDSQTLESVVVGALLERGLSVTVAESCTGGLLAKRITDISGSSGCFTQGIVAYHNDAKVTLLGVAPEILAEHGAVSDQVARAMAEGARVGAGSDFALSTTGIAGPTGGTSLKPVGLVYIALASADGTVSKRLQLRGKRAEVRDRASKHALNLLRLHIMR
ncbi:MAG: competence/damage-inducible protein A [Planctomycetes bacterium]|nr:competence/damage-inducible protein A [Planctomycetota bacterium]